jgi:hydrogenase maturation protease
MNVLVLGLGSVLMGDDAVGPWAMRLLEAGYAFPPAVTLLDAGTPGPEVAHYVAGLDALVVIDSVRHRQLPPGTVVELRDDAVRRGLPAPRLSPHDPNLRDALLACELLPGGPPKRVVLLGVVPEKVELGTGLTAAVRAALPRLVQAVVDELTQLGLTPTALPATAAPEVWWERVAG